MEHKTPKVVRLPPGMSLEDKEKVIDRIVGLRKSKLMASAAAPNALVHIPAELVGELTQFLAEFKAT